MSYNPTPTRVWSRVQNQCTYTIPDDTYSYTYIPLTGQTVTQTQADYETKQIYKGNILQYKGNSARLTKSQKYAQLARMAGPNRTKVFATQSQTYSNPNTTGLLRAGYVSYPFPNDIVGAPNNTSGPFAYGISNPFDCSGNDIVEGGVLVCGTYVNPCTNEIVSESSVSDTICNSASASDVPGSGVLCWNKNVQTWFPRQRYTMNNSTDKWPYNYKGFVSAIKPGKPCPPILYLENITSKIVNNSIDNATNVAAKNVDMTNNVPLDQITMINQSTYQLLDNNNNISMNSLHNIHISWNPNYHHTIDYFKLYINYKFHKNIKNIKIHKYIIPNFKVRGSIITLTSVANNIESGMSNPIVFNPYPIDTTPLIPNETIDDICCHNLKLSIDALREKVDNINDSLDHQLNYISGILDIKLSPIKNTCQSLTSSITELLANSSSILNKVNAIKCCDCSGCSGFEDASCNCDIYNKLFESETITKINEYVLSYISHIHEDTDIYISIDTFDELNANLLSLSDIFALDPSCCFLNVFDIYKNMLKIVKTGFDNKNLAKITSINSEKWRQDSALLHDPDKLKEYVQALNKSFFLINLSISSSKAMLKPQYAIYHEMYGIPDKLEYDPYLMKPILVSLGIS